MGKNIRNGKRATLTAQTRTRPRRCASPSSWRKKGIYTNNQQVELNINSKTLPGSNSSQAQETENVQLNVLRSAKPATRHPRGNNGHALGCGRHPPRWRPIRYSSGIERLKVCLRRSCDVPHVPDVTDTRRRPMRWSQRPRRRLWS